MATDKVLLYGNSGLTTKVLKSDKSGYDDEATVWSGLVDAEITFTQTTTSYPADNDPEYKAFKGKPTGTGKITLRGIKYADYKKIMDVIYDVETGIDFGSSNGVKYFSLALTEEVDDDSQNRHILFNCRVDGIPPLSTKTVADTTTPRDIPINIVVNPLFKTDDTTKWRFYRVINSKEQSALFEQNKDDITFPFEEIE